MNIGLDLDGVLADVVTPFCEILSKENDFSFKPLDVTDYNFVKCVPPHLMQPALKLIKNPDLFKQVKPFTEAPKFVRELSENNSVYIITSRPSNLTELTGEFVQTYFPTIKGIFFNRKKGPVAKQLKCRAFLDDYPKNIEEISHYRIKSFLLDTTYNRKIMTGDSRFVKRVFSLSDFLEEIESMNIKGGI